LQMRHFRGLRLMLRKLLGEVRGNRSAAWRPPAFVTQTT
jgi:hypothetical protein